METLKEVLPDEGIEFDRALSYPTYCPEGLMLKEEVLLQKRLIELSKISYQRDIVTFSDFLNLNELNILHTMPNQIHTAHTTLISMVCSAQLITME